MDFPIEDLMDQAACSQRLLDLLHPGGLACPHCGGAAYTVHRRRPGSPVVDYRCKGCGRFFNLYTGTPWQGTRKSPATILLILRGVVQGVPTAQLARELGLSRPHLLELRHQIQARAVAGADRVPLPDDTTEADEMYQNAGEKRHPAPRPDRPAQAPRQQAPRARHLGHRPAAGAGGGRPGERPALATGGAEVRGGGVGRRHGGARDKAGSGGEHRRVGRVQAAAAARPGARDGQPRGG